MIAAWVLYATMVGTLAAGAAWILDALLRSHQKSTRWIWAASMGFSFLWPVLTVLLPESTPRPSVLQGVSTLAMEPLIIRVGNRSLWQIMETPLIAAWVLSSLLLTLAGLGVLLRSRRIRREWAGGSVRGKPVLLSENWGPAVVGFFHSQIVLPRWCRAMEGSGLDLILAHESEHLEAGDLRLIILAGIPPVLLPWSLPLWWMWHRLRLAVEGDCDLRVLRKNPRATRAYLELLLEVGQHMPGARAAAAMLSEAERTLERRIKIMTMPVPRRPMIRGAILITAGLGLIAVACLAPTPTALREDADVPAAEAVPQQASLAQEPVFTPFTVRPDIKNRSEVARALEENYPPLVRDAGIGGTTTVWVFVDDKGQVQNTRLNQSSGHQALDEAALRVANAIEFTPAMNRDAAVPVWISLPITFSVR